MIWFNWWAMFDGINKKSNICCLLVLSSVGLSLSETGLLLALQHFEGWSQDCSKSDGCFSQYVISSPWRSYEDYNISFCKQWKFRCHCSYEQWHQNLHCLQRGQLPLNKGFKNMFELLQSNYFVHALTVKILVSLHIFAMWSWSLLVRVYTMV